MGILPLLLIAVSTVLCRTDELLSVGQYHVLRTISEAKSDFGHAAAVVTSTCDGKRVIKKESYADVILAIDTSFCNHYRIEQVKSTVHDFVDSLTDTETGGQKLGQNVRISLVTFNNDIEVVHSFDEYNNGASSSHNHLNQEIAKLYFSDSTTDYDEVFFKLRDAFAGQFRDNAKRALVIYSNGNQFAEPNYREIQSAIEDLDVGTFGLSFSPYCDGSLTDEVNLDKVCPNAQFFEMLTDSKTFSVPSHGAIMEIRQSLYGGGSAETSSHAAIIGNRQCETGFPVDCEASAMGKNGLDGTAGKRGPQGPSGKAGQDGSDGRPGVDGPTGFSGKQGDRGAPGRHGEQGNSGTPGPQGTQGPKGRVGPRGNAGKSIRGMEGFPGVLGEPGVAGRAGNPGRQGDQGLNGQNGEPGRAGYRGAAGKPGQPGANGVPGNDGECPPGAEGPTGHSGVPGENGEPGNDGLPGATGKNGTPGSIGSPGAPGLTGKRGKVGEPGERGFDGCHGKDGYDGPRGMSGQIGAPGINAANGEKGRQGDPGELGEIGLEGARGDKGARGANGPDGPKGACGHEGCDGPRGAIGPPGDSGKDGVNGIDGQPGSPGCPGKNGARGKAGNPGVIDPDEVELLVLKAIRELLQECHGSTDDNDDWDDRGRTDDIDEEN